jgi:hypothetical protein
MSFVSVTRGLSAFDAIEIKIWPNSNGNCLLLTQDASRLKTHWCASDFAYSFISAPIKNCSALMDETSSIGGAETAYGSAIFWVVAVLRSADLKVVVCARLYESIRVLT